MALALAFLVSLGGCAAILLAVDSPIAAHQHWVWLVAGFLACLLSALTCAWLLFRAAREPECAWPLGWRLAAQTPGWMLAAAGAVVVFAKARQELETGVPGLGVGIAAAVLWRVAAALRRPAEDERS